MPSLSRIAREVKVRTRRLRLAGRHWGAPEGVPILALHGWLDNAASFDRLLPELDLSRYQVLALDLPGHGRSQHRPVGDHYHLLEYVVDVVEVAQACGWSSFHLLGHSLGGAIAMLTASAYPDRVRSLMLIDAMGPMVNGEKETPAQLRKAIDRYLQGNGKGPTYASIDDAVQARQRGVSQLSDPVARMILARNLKKGTAGYSWRTDPRLRWPSLWRMSEAQTLACLAAIQCPTLLIAGEEGFLKTYPALVEERLRAIPALRLVYAAGGHHLHLEPLPEAVAELIQDFLAGNSGSA